jgi:hypothetical protein
LSSQRVHYQAGDCRYQRSGTPKMRGFLGRVSLAQMITVTGMGPGKFA